MKPAADRGAVIHLHTDGDIRALLPDLLTLPLGVLNLQDTVNGIDWIAEQIKGRFAIDLDVDRIVLSREARPEAVADYLESAVTRLFDPAGGLILTYGLYPGVPPENVRALAESFRNIAEYRRNS
jgi:uroporphyrinogen decarboxylase